MTNTRYSVVILSEAFLKPCQTLLMTFFAEIVNDFYLKIETILIAPVFYIQMQPFADVLQHKCS